MGLYMKLQTLFLCLGITLTSLSNEKNEFTREIIKSFIKEYPTLDIVGSETLNFELQPPTLGENHKDIIVNSVGTCTKHNQILKLEGYVEIDANLPENKLPNSKIELEGRATLREDEWTVASLSFCTVGPRTMKLRFTLKVVLDLSDEAVKLWIENIRTEVLANHN
jgi:hypothetical protein